MGGGERASVPASRRMPPRPEKWGNPFLPRAEGFFATKYIKFGEGFVAAGLTEFTGLEPVRRLNV